jgi:transcriptional regulator with XRE-family HTH domain
MEQYADRAIDRVAVRRLRLEARYTLQALATAADMGIATLSAWEVGRVPDDHRPRIATVLRLAEALSRALGREVNPDELLRPREPAGVAS